jgi:hypothetical protein
MLLAIAVMASMFLHREFTGIEKLIAGVVAIALGAAWWIVMHRRLSTTMRTLKRN